MPTLSDLLSSAGSGLEAGLGTYLQLDQARQQRKDREAARELEQLRLSDLLDEREYERRTREQQAGDVEALAQRYSEQTGVPIEQARAAVRQGATSMFEPEEDRTQFATAGGRTFDLSDPQQVTAYEQAFSRLHPVREPEDPTRYGEAGGRTFDLTTPEGQTGYSETFDRLHPPGSGPSGASEEVSRRARAMAAARALAEVQEQQLDRLGTGQDPSAELVDLRNRVVRAYGYDSPLEVYEDMRTLGRSAPTAAEAGGEGTGADLTTRIDQLIQEGLTDEEIEERLLQEGLIG